MTKKELIQLINEVIDEISINKGFESHDDDDLCKVSYVDRSQVLAIIKQNNNFHGIDSTDLDLIKSFNYTNAYCKNSFGKTKMIEFYRNKNKDDAIVLVSLDDGKNWHVTSGGDSKSKLNEVDKPAYYNFYGIEKIKKIIKNNNNFNGVNNILDIIEKKKLYYSTGVQPIGFIKNTKVIEFSKTTQGPPELTLVTSDNGRTWKPTSKQYHIDKKEKDELLKKYNNFKGIPNQILNKIKEYEYTSKIFSLYSKNSIGIDFFRTDDGKDPIRLISNDGGKNWSMLDINVQTSKSLKKEIDLKSLLSKVLPTKPSTLKTTNEPEKSTIGDDEKLEFAKFMRSLTDDPINLSPKILSDDRLDNKIFKLWQTLWRNRKETKFELEVAKSAFIRIFSSGRTNLLGISMGVPKEDLYYVFRILGYFGFYPQKDIKMKDAENFQIIFIKENKGKENIKDLDNNKLYNLLNKIYTSIVNFR